MPDLYTSGEYIPELKGVIHGGTTIVIHSPEQIGGLLAMCSVVTSQQEGQEQTHLEGRHDSQTNHYPVAPTSSPRQNPLEGVYRFLNGPFIDLKEGWFQMPLQPENFSNWQNITSIDTLNDKEALMVILSLAYTIWNQQGGKNADLCLAMSIGDFTSTPNPVLEYEGDNTGFLLLKGSIISTLMLPKSSGEQVTGPVKFVCKAVGFAVVFFRGRGMTASKIVTNLVEDMRTKASKKAQEKLDRLDTIAKGGLSNNRGVIVFLHGLLSTDCGTFDTLIEKWKEPQDYDLTAIDPKRELDHDGIKKALSETLSQDYILVGWPHDTLTRIDNNAFELFRLLEDIVNPELQQPLLAFVCHSRGGLVARGAAEKLLAKSDKWQPRLRGCVTFGTPHEGAALAEFPPERFIAEFVKIMALRNTNAVLSLADILLYQEQCKGFPGIQDLRPPGTGGDFLRTLREKEIEKAQAGEQRRLDIFAIGGHIAQQNPVLKMVQRAFGHSEHDLVVETSSSISRYLARTERVECDHMSYFSKEQSQGLHFARVILYLRKALKVHESALERYYVAQTQAGNQKEESIDLSSLFKQEIRRPRKEESIDLSFSFEQEMRHGREEL